MSEYNPAQQQVIDLLGRGEAAPQFAPDLVVRLRAELEEAIAPLAPQLGGESRDGLGATDQDARLRAAQEFIAAGGDKIAAGLDTGLQGGL